MKNYVDRVLDWPETYFKAQLTNYMAQQNKTVPTNIKILLQSFVNESTSDSIESRRDRWVNRQTDRQTDFSKLNSIMESGRWEREVKIAVCLTVLFIKKVNASWFISQ